MEKFKDGFGEALARECGLGGSCGRYGMRLSRFEAEKLLPVRLSFEGGSGVEGLGGLEAGFE